MPGLSVNGRLVEDVDSDSVVTLDFDENVVAVCSECAEALEEDDDGEWVGEDSGSWCYMNHGEGHVPVTPMDAVVNNVQVDLGPNRVDVSISVGDPRGGFVMSVERMKDGSLRLSTPHGDDPMPHRKLVPLASPGYWEIV